MLHEPGGGAAPRGAIVYVQPFAEEMNKSRRMAALQSRALAARGWMVVQPDLEGCGDSEGEFGSCDWRSWVADVIDAAAYVGERSGLTPKMWGLRAGCLLACAAARQLPDATDIVMWQPVASGSAFLRQFLRLKVAAAMFGSAEQKVDSKSLLDALAQGRAVEIAGYTVGPALAAGLEEARLEPAATPARVCWLEVSNRTPAELAPAAATPLAAFAKQGHLVTAQAVTGPPFWQTQEIEECPALLDATCTALDAWLA